MHFGILAEWAALLLCLNILPVAVGRGLCGTDVSASTLARHLSKNAVPQAGRAAGRYYTVSTALTLAACTVNCCAVPHCNVVLFVRRQCLLVACNASVPHGCEPRHQPADGDKTAYMINVRSVEETADLAKSDDQTSLSSVSSRPCTEDADCHEDEFCDDAVNTCRCEDGNHRDDADKCVTTGSTAVPDKGSTPPALDTHDYCELGLADQCGQGEVCAVRNSRSRAGYCACRHGYLRDERTHVCQPAGVDAALRNESNTQTESNETAEIHAEGNGTQASTATSLLSASTSIATMTPTSTTTSSTSSSTTATTTTSSTTTTTATLTKKEKKARLIPLVVSVGDNKLIRLPVNSVTLSAYVLPKDSGDEYTYEWTLPLHPEGEDVGTMAGMNTATLQVSKLKAGNYTFKVAVTANGKYGDVFVNVTVLRPVRKNTPPVAVVKPKSQKISQSNNVILDGSESTDDDKVVSYLWGQVSGPLSNQRIDPDDLKKPMIVLKNLVPGEYRFKLTVTDSDAVENSTFANVTVTKETDYPPKANAGSNVIMSLPKNSVTLYGNKSTDDKGIATYEWIKKSDSDKLAADMRGVRTSILHLDHLQEGDYTFTLKVTDSSGQVSTADVHVFVKPEHNKPPVARPGYDRIVTLPVNFVALDGSNSTDDQHVEKYHWTQVSGPTTVSIDNSDRAIATASHLAIGAYQFKLQVEDAEKLESSAVVRITVKEDTNIAPKADAGGDRIVALPLTLVIVDGSASSDDKQIVRYTWTRQEKSLAAGVVLNGSDHRAVLQLTDLVAGRYVFILKVVDAEGLSSSDSAALVVKPHIYAKDLIEITLDADIKEFTQANKVNLQNDISLLLHKSSEEGETEVTVERLDTDTLTGNLLVEFYVTSVMRDAQRVWSGTDTVATLRRRLRTEAEMFNFKIVRLDTVVCQNNCSHHGRCSQRTRLCVCEPFWMQNPVRAYGRHYNSNCEWSILYVIIIAFVFVIALASLVWCVVCLCRRWRRWKPRKRRHYSLLHEGDSDDDRSRIQMRQKGGLQRRQVATSLMMSDSDLTSQDDEETIFTNQRPGKGNGHVRNGFRPTKVKT